MTGRKWWSCAAAVMCLSSLLWAQGDTGPSPTSPAGAPAPEVATSPETPLPGTPVTPSPVTPAPVVVPVPLEQVPYRVRLELVIDLGPDDSRAARQRLRDEISGLLTSQIGAFWEIDLVDDEAAWLNHPADVSRRDTSDFEPFLDGTADKVFLAGVQRRGVETHTIAREWDLATRTLSLPQSRTTTDPRETAHCLVQSIQGAFRPLVLIEQTKEGAVTLRGRAAQISPHDPVWNPLRPGTVFEPYYRYLNKERRVEKIQRIPWTYLVAGAPVPDEGRAPGIPVSGLRTAISARRRRIEAVALGVSIAEAPTTVRLTTRPPARRAIVGVEVLIRAERFAPPVVEGSPPAPPLAKLVTDRRGEITVPPGLVPRGAPVWLFVYSGSQMLGRVPFVPGIRPLEELELADDSLRLQVEGDIALLQARLVDLAAQRAVLMALVRKRANEKDFAAVDALLQKVDESVKPPALLADLNTIRSPALKSAREMRDKATEARIKKLCDDTAEIITVHFSDEKIGELKDEVRELKEIAADEAAGKEPRPKKVRPKKPPTRGASPASPATPQGGAATGF